MKIIGVLNELFRNPDKRFKAMKKFDSDIDVLSHQEYFIWIDDRHLISFEIRSYFKSGKYAATKGYGLPNLSLNVLKELEWEEIKKPITFIEVLNITIIENKRIKLKHPDIASITGYLTDILEELNNEVGYERGSREVARILLKGEFYVED